MRIIKRVGKVRLLIIILVIMATAISVPILAINNNETINEPPISIAQYRVDVLGQTYYGVAYGIKKDGVLRFEVIDYNPEIVQLDENYLPSPGQIRILEMPAGKWKLMDRLTGNQIKP